jgi:hypothetical protein
LVEQEPDARVRKLAGMGCHDFSHSNLRVSQSLFGDCVQALI